MCGLVGYFGDWFLPREKGFYDLLRVDVLRGPDSTGVAFFGLNGSLKICKDALLPEHLIISKEFEKAAAYQWNGYIGHNRFATKGGINKNNAHPFSHGSITGAHNGTLIRQTLLPDHEKFQVDSENIIYSIDKIGIAETWKKIDGAAALSWWNRKERTLNLLRNDDRPIIFAATKDNSGVFWASETWMLYGMAERNNIALDKIYILPKNVLYSYSLLKDKKTKDLTLALTETTLDGFKWGAYVGYNYAGHNSYNNNHYDDDWYKDLKTKDVEPLFPLHNEKKKDDGFNSVIQKDNTAAFKNNFKPGRFALEPEKIIRTFNNNNLVSNRLFCHLVKRPDIKVELSLTEDQAKKFNAYVEVPHLFSEVLFICDVKSVIWYKEKEKQVLLVGNPKTTVVHIPKNSYRTMITGAKLTKEQFNKTYIKCIYCEDALSFDDALLEEDAMSENILCGKCVVEANEGHNGGYTIDALFQAARN